MQPYKWESKPSWYDAKLNSANFLLLSQEPGYFTQFAVNGVALQLLNNWYSPPAYPAGWPHYYKFGGYYWAPASKPPHELVKIYYYTACAFGEELEDSLGSQAQERLADRGPRDPDRSGDLAFSDHPPVAKVPSRIRSLVHK